MPQHVKKQEEVLEWMRRLDIFSELVALNDDGSYKNELDLDVILYGRGYTGGRVGPYVRLLRYGAGEKLIREDEWSMERHTPEWARGDGRAARAPSSDDGGDEPTPGGEREWDGNSFFVLVDGTFCIDFKDGNRLACNEPGRIVGAMMLLEGNPADYTAVVPVGAVATVIEFKRPAIRLLRKYRKFAQAFDEDYRKYGLKCVLRDVTRVKRENFLAAFVSRARRRFGRTTPAAPKLRPGQWDEITKSAKFEVFDKNHVLFQAGRPITHVLLVKKGWVEVAPPAATVEAAATAAAAAATGGGALSRRGVRYLGAGNCFGLEAIAKADAVWDATAILLARTELLTLPVKDLRGDPALEQSVRGVFSGFSEADEETLSQVVAEDISEARRREITTGIVDGTNLLVMDMDLCVRCGNCSLACHKVHGHSRLMRRGIQIERPRERAGTRPQHVLAPSVCLHCQDPECLTGCPTGSIARYPEGQIDINPQTCIGCGDCATQCPYNAISLVSRNDLKHGHRPPPPPAAPAGGSDKLWPGWKARAARLYRRGSIRTAGVDLTPPAATTATAGEPLVAIKCNLCHGTPLNTNGSQSGRTAYSCEENCPTGALVRVNPREYFGEIRNVIGTIYLDRTHAIGRNIHRRDLPARLWHAGGLLSTVALAAASLWAAGRYGLNTPLPGTVWTLRWLTGFAGLACLAVSLAYFVRKQIYRRRAGALRYWLLAHVYSSVIGSALFLVHGGRRSGGLLTSALMVSFDLVILSGLFGLACYKLAPRIMTRIEGQPLLIEDLRERRAELREELAGFDPGDEHLNGHQLPLRPLIEEHVRARFFTLGYLWRQFWRRESLTKLQARARDEFDKQAKALNLDRATRAQLIKAVEAAATSQRVEALIYLHRLLKLWVAPHVAFTVLMLLLLAAHLAQVWFFTVH